MNTEILKINSKEDKKEIIRAAQILKSGGLVAIPTETVYGLAANAFCENAVANIFKAKGRPQDNPLIVHISEFSEIYNLVQTVPENAKKLAENFWPGPLTIILKKSDKIPEVVSGGLDTVAVRMPSNPIAREIIKDSGVPLAAPSANLSGSPSPTCFKYVYDDMNGRIDAIVDGGESAVGVESTVITLATDVPTVLRPGGITVEQLRDVLGEVNVDKGVLESVKLTSAPASPGMKYKHYSPKANVIVLNGSLEAFEKYVKENATEKSVALVFDGDDKNIDIPCVCFGEEKNSEKQAQLLFSALRKVDEMNADIVFARCPTAEGVGLAVCNRLFRAAAFEIIDL